jgi:hypothetical protein
MKHVFLKSALMLALVPGGLRAESVAQEADKIVKGWWCCGASDAVAPTPKKKEGFKIFNDEGIILSPDELLAAAAPLLIETEAEAAAVAESAPFLVYEKRFEIDIVVEQPFLDNLLGWVAHDRAFPEQRFAYFLKAVVDGGGAFEALSACTIITLDGRNLKEIGSLAVQQTILKGFLRNERFARYLANMLNREKLPKKVVPSAEGEGIVQFEFMPLSEAVGLAPIGIAAVIKELCCDCSKKMK